MYDIRDPARWRKAHRLVRGYGTRVQYSVFRIRASQTDIERLRWELERVLAAEDSLLFVPLCPSCAERVKARNSPDDWGEEPASFEIIE